MTPDYPPVWTYQPYVPATVTGALADIPITPELLYWYPWIAQLPPRRIYLWLMRQWQQPGGRFPDPPPPGYDYYITSGDSLMFGLPEHIAPHVQGRIIHLTGCVIQHNFDTDQIQYVSYNHAHRRIKRIPRAVNFQKHIRYKASALVNRVSQSKAIVFAALMRYLDQDQRVVSLHNALWNPRNVHAWQPSGHAVCDDLTQEFAHTWANQRIKLPQDDGVEGSYNNTAYSQTAVNFTQESYHYSQAHFNNQNVVKPGPFVTEKTWKCLVSGTAFISVGMHNVYQWLQSLGCRFDYGALDLGFDQDPGDLTRLAKIVELIQRLDQHSAQDLYDMTRTSTLHNQQWVQSAEFWDVCEASNAGFYELMANLP